jgi:hypothetical protein
MIDRGLRRDGDRSRPLNLEAVGPHGVEKM